MPDQMLLAVNYIHSHDIAACQRAMFTASFAVLAERCPQVSKVSSGASGAGLGGLVFEPFLSQEFARSSGPCLGWDRDLKAMITPSSSFHLFA